MLRRKLSGYEEINTEIFNSRETDKQAILEQVGLQLSNGWNPERGEVGAYASHYRSWELAAKLNEPLMVFEDDAVLDTNFHVNFPKQIAELPDDWDFFAMWVPDNQKNHYTEYITVNGPFEAPTLKGIRYDGSTQFGCYRQFICRSYQGYGQVAIMYRPSGAQKLIDNVQQHGMYNTVDCTMHFLSLARQVNGYAPKPAFANLVHHDFNVPSTVHGTGF